LELVRAGIATTHQNCEYDEMMNVLWFLMPISSGFCRYSARGALKALVHRRARGNNHAAPSTAQTITSSASETFRLQYCTDVVPKVFFAVCLLLLACRVSADMSRHKLRVSAAERQRVKRARALVASRQILTR
jgi:hypothetical protein